MDDQRSDQNQKGGGSVSSRKALFVIIALVVVVMSVCVAVVCFEAGELWPLALLYRGPLILLIGFVVVLPVLFAIRYRK